MDLLACSGPGAGDAILKNTAWANFLAGVQGVMLLASFRLVWNRLRERQVWVIPALLAGLVAFHPAWTIGVRADCGHTLFNASVLCIFARCQLLLWQLWIWLAGRSRE